MELYASSSDVRNMDLQDRNGYLIYRVQTHKTSDISRFAPTQYGGPPQPVVVAQVEWHDWHDVVLKFRGNSIKAKKFIKSKGFVHNEQVFTASSGQSYGWNGNVLNSNGHEVARWHSKSHGFTGQAHPAYMQVSQEALNDLDEILMTFVYNKGTESDYTQAAVIGAIA